MLLQDGREKWLPERTQEEAAKYAEAAKETAELCGVPVLDVYGQLMQLPDWEALQDDGLHFNSAGQTKVFDLLVEALWEHFPLLRCFLSQINLDMLQVQPPTEGLGCLLQGAQIYVIQRPYTPASPIIPRLPLLH